MRAPAKPGLGEHLKELIGGKDQNAESVAGPNFRYLVEYSPDGILVIDLDGAVLYANVAAAELFGCSRSELETVPIGRPVISADAVDLVTRRLDGHARQLEMRVIEVTWGGSQALFATLRDVSTQRLLEAQSHQAQKLEAVGRLAAGVAHDFNNILAVVRAGISLILRQRRGMDQRSEQILHELYERTEGGGDLVRKLLTFSRDQELIAAPLDINARVTSLAGLLRATIGGHIALELHLDEHLPLVVVDGSHLEAALVNLVVNSRDAIEGSGVIRISTKLAREDAAPSVSITVEDDGHGMPADVIDKVVEPFFTTKRDSGTGLGLSQVHGFAKQSGGDILIDSYPGMGTRVTIVLPLGEAPQETS